MLVVECFKKVCVENKDVLRFIKCYLDWFNILLYFDFFYFGDRSSSYENDVNDVDFYIKMFKFVNKVYCMIFISVYEYFLYEFMFREENGWWCK